ncbi:hypothetical protein J2125_004277 [Erwinia toletana]|uniref:Uncharacterized protein n=1 Tax=Winslowiella toletana TaxID=92490 RepID=A0ABS4PG50_9GAMM|nr:hypothetical protein [Winslowiella toletana]MBP2171085.1 hypothetical protein [Winslowiella toletana]
MKKALSFAPLLIWIAIFIYALAFIAIVIQQKSPADELIPCAIFASMLILVLYIVSYGVASGERKQREADKLATFFLLHKQGRLHGVIKSSRYSLILYLLATLLFLAQDNTAARALLMLSSIVIVMVIVDFWFLHYQQIGAEYRARSWKVLAICFSAILFFANMLSSQFILEAFDIEPARLNFTRWSFSLIMVLLLMSPVSYFVLLIHGAFMRVARRSRRQAMMALFDSVTVTTLLFGMSLLLLITTKLPVLGNAMTGYFYHFDTRTTFSCKQQYHIIPRLGDQAGYIKVAEGEYRAIYQKQGGVYVETVICQPDGSYKLNDIRYASDIRRLNQRMAANGS